MNDNKLRAIIAVSFAIVMCIGIICSTYADTHAKAENQADYITCGACGAHVHDWWYVENINDGEPVEVCEFCYSSYVENMNVSNATENN